MVKPKVADKAVLRKKKIAITREKLKVMTKIKGVIEDSDPDDGGQKRKMNI